MITQSKYLKNKIHPVSNRALPLQRLVKKIETNLKKYLMHLMHLNNLPPASPTVNIARIPLAG
jgi:hypothetical protein